MPGSFGPLDPLSEVVDENRRWNSDWYGWLVELTSPRVVKAGVLLDPKAAKAVGDRGFVTDATSTTFGSVVAGGGTNTVPVYFDGTNWRIG